MGKTTAWMAASVLVLASCQKRGSLDARPQDTHVATCKVTGLTGSSQSEAWRITPSSPRVYALMDLSGDLDGFAERNEWEALVRNLEQRAADAFSCHRAELVKALRATESSLTPGQGVGYLNAALRALPTEARRMALRADLEWGDGDAQASREELEKAQAFYKPLRDIFPQEAGALEALLRGDAGSLAPVAAPAALRLEAAQALNEAMNRSALAAPWLNAQALYHAPDWHEFSVLEHCARAKEKMEYLLSKFGIVWEEGPILMALHDIGKIADRIWKGAPGDAIAGFTFDDHAPVGSDLVKKAGWEYGSFLVANHEAIRKKSREEILAISDNPVVRRHLVLMFLADNLGKGETTKLHDQWETLLAPKFLELAEDAGLDERILRQIFSEHGITPRAP